MQISWCVWTGWSETLVSILLDLGDYQNRSSLPAVISNVQGEGVDRRETIDVHKDAYSTSKTSSQNRLNHSSRPWFSSRKPRTYTTAPTISSTRSEIRSCFKLPLQLTTDWIIDSFRMQRWCKWILCLFILIPHLESSFETECFVQKWHKST